MDDFISREETIKRIEEVYCVGCNSYHGVRCRACGTGDAIDMIEDAPAADVAPVVHGRWKCHGDCRVTECPVCGWSIEEYVGDYAYCPICGANMRGSNYE